MFPKTSKLALMLFIERGFARLKVMTCYYK